ncbi:ABC transporter substrate-binding protein [Longispora albida]|uniref:ABC transporter substrate-binding protein n=1 Tax=Longispora albida TaxID=203523 RepID=UPI0003714379|nr:ABC transporter substrate-binding protein [Longispora albida]
MAAAVGLTSACTPDGEKASPAPLTPKAGGTLNLILRGQLDHLDPTEVYLTSAMNVSRLINRTLVTFKDAPGTEGSEIAPDLATDLGRTPDGGKTWEFTLKKGVAWEDGTPVTCAHVKYGIERRFAAEYKNGPSYPKDYLADTAGYKGPYVGKNNNGKGLTSIECPGGELVRFKLKFPIGDFPYTLTMPVWAPIPPEKDINRKDMDIRPFANGPYKVAQSFDGKGGPLILDRNPHWNPSTDSVRKAYPDKIQLIIRENQDEEVTDELIKDQGEAKNSIALQLDATPNFVQQIVNDPELSKRAVTGAVPGTSYMAINMSKVPDIRCRQALVMAFNKRRFRATIGGSIFGEYATTMIPPDLKAHKKFDVHGVNAYEEGNPEKARALMEQAAKDGKPCAKTLTVNFQDTKKWQRAMATVVESFALIDITLELKPLAARTYYVEAGVQQKQGDLTFASWLPDWSNGSSVIQPNFDGRLIPKDKTQTGNLNFAQLNDPEINKRIDAAMAEPNLDKQYVMWGELDEEIQKRAPIIPVYHPKILRLHGSKVHNAFLHPAWGEADISAMWIG